MVLVGEIRKGAYFDSVTLMTVGKEVSATEGVVDAAVVMGTRENKAILDASGLLTPEFAEARDTDLLIGIKADNDAAAQTALAGVEELLKNARNKGDSDEAFKPKSLEGALEILPEANMAMISVAGRYAGNEAMKALEKGLHVMLFSDNVSVETEVELKKFARDKGLLVMGPDCGTAIINGIPLAFANVVNRGDIGCVAAAGTGLQEVTTLISNAGGGISQAIGTGGRDVKKDVGGIMLIEGIKALAEDDDTKVILLVSKPPHADVLAKVNKLVEGIGKPVVSILLGAEPTSPNMAATLEEAALKAVALSKGESLESVTAQLDAREADLEKQAEDLSAKRKNGQKFVRALFSGGTFCSEAQLLFRGHLSPVYSNAPAGDAQPLADSLKSQAHTVVDLGEDEFTVGRPHPMIDFSLRNKRIEQEANDPETAVILLDVVLGYGSNLDPAGELRDVVKDATGKVSVVCSITGTDRDPQNRSAVEAVLKEAGAIVMPSNAAASKLAAYIAERL